VLYKIENYCTHYKVLGEANANEPVRTRSTHLRYEKFIQNFSRIPEVKDQLH